MDTAALIMSIISLVGVIIQAIIGKNDHDIEAKKIKIELLKAKQDRLQQANTQIVNVYTRLEGVNLYDPAENSRIRVEYYQKVSSSFLSVGNLFPELKNRVLEMNKRINSEIIKAHANKGVCQPSTIGVDDLSDLCDNIEKSIERKLIEIEAELEESSK